MTTKNITPALLGLLSVIFFNSGITRHDVAEEEYLNYAKQKQFEAVGQLFIDSVPGGSCVLIGKNRVLTAAHCVFQSDYRADTLEMNGQTLISFQPYNIHLVDPSRVFVSFLGKKTGVRRIIIHPNYQDSMLKGTCDIAFIELDAPINTIQPARLNRKFNELHSKVSGAGFGASGKADKPETVKLEDKKIAGQNVIDSLGGYTYSGQPALLFCDFDHPGDTLCNKLGSARPQQLEYISSGGDSGGGLFSESDSGWVLVGICSGSHTNIAQLLKTGYYGQIMEWTRISLFVSWIEENGK